MLRIKTTENALQLLSDVRRGQWFVHDYEALLPAALAHNRAAGAFLQSGVMTGTPTIEVGDLQRELGPYLSQGNNLDILQQVYQSFSTSKHLTWKRAVTEYKAALAQSVDHVVQQFKPQWTPRGGAKFEPLTIKNYRHKVNFPVIPAEVGESWLFYLYDEGLSPDQMPITRYIVDKVLLPQIAEDIENVMISKAKFVEDSQKTEDAMDGFETILVDAKKSRNKHFRFFNTDKNLLEATDDEVLETIDDFVASFAPLYKSKQMPVFLSSDIYLKYKRAYKKKWGAGSGTEKANFGEDRVDFSNCYLQVLDSLYGSPIVFSTPKENFVGLRHKNPEQFISDIQKRDYEVRFFCEFWLGVGFLLGEAVFAIVPDGYDPKAAIASTREGTPGKWIVFGEAEGAADARGYKKGVKFEHPGNSSDIEDFIEYNSNRNLGTIVRSCNGKQVRIFGDPCNPLSLKAETQDTKDGMKTTITLQQDVRDAFRVLTYTGELPGIIDEAPESQSETV